jgi:peptidyl-prolyl cis-trans isomerase C
MFKAISLWLAVLLPTSSLLLSSPAFTQDKIIAIVNGKGLTESDMRLAAIEFASELRQVPVAKRDGMLIELLIEQQLVADLAQKTRLDESGDFSNRMRFMKRRALRDELMDKQIVHTVTESDAMRVYQDQAAKLKPEEELRVRHILVSTETEATTIRSQVSPSNFADFARRQSKDQGSSWNGGDIGYITRGQMDEEFETAAFSLKAGTISGPVRTKFGWHIILVEERRIRELPDFDSVKEDIIKLLIQRRVQDLVSSLRSSADIEIMEPELSGPLAAPDASSSRTGQTFLGLSSYGSKEGAEDDANKAKRRFQEYMNGMEIQVIQVELPKMGTRYRVVMGPFQGKEAAEMYCNDTVKPRGWRSCFIISSANH